MRAQVGGGGEKCQVDYGFLWLLAAAVTVSSGNVSVHVGWAIKQNKQADRQRTEERQVNGQMPRKKTKTSSNRAIYLFMFTGDRIRNP